MIKFLLLILLLMNIEKIDAAIAAHSAWKGRLRLAIDTGKSEFDPIKAVKDNECDFGKWLYSLTGAETNDEHFIKVKQNHAEFHRVAGRVLKLALEGKKEEAEKEIKLDSEFSSASSKCIMALTDWKKSLK